MNAINGVKLTYCQQQKEEELDFFFYLTDPYPCLLGTH